MPQRGKRKYLKCRLVSEFLLFPRKQTEMFEQLLIKADIDAGTGHLLLQLGLALLAGSLFYIRSITEWFRGDKKETVAEPYTAPAPEPETVVEIATTKPKATKPRARKTNTTTKARSKKTAKTSTRRRAS